VRFFIYLTPQTSSRYNIALAFKKDYVAASSSLFLGGAEVKKKTQISDWHSPKGYGVADRDIRGKKEPNILNSAVGRAQNNKSPKFCFFCLPSADL
jgi:hypothetical protein